MGTYNIITIGREFGSGGREVGLKRRRDWVYLSTTRRSLRKHQKRAGIQKNCLKNMMRNLQAVSFIHWRLELQATAEDIRGHLYLIFIWPSLIRSGNLQKTDRVYL